MARPGSARRARTPTRTPTRPGLRLEGPPGKPSPEGGRGQPAARGGPSGLEAGPEKPPLASPRLASPGAALQASRWKPREKGASAQGGPGSLNTDLRPSLPPGVPALPPGVPDPTRQALVLISVGKGGFGAVLFFHSGKTFKKTIFFIIQ